MKPIRSCIICRKKACKGELLRIVFCDGIAKLDVNKKINARGIYLCKDKKCLDKARNLLLKNKLILKKHFEKESLLKIIDDVENELGE